MLQTKKNGSTPEGEAGQSAMLCGLVVYMYMYRGVECRDISVAPVDIKFYDERFSSLTTSLGKNFMLPMFRLDALVLLRENEEDYSI